MQGGAASTPSGIDIAVFGDAGEAAVRTKMKVHVDDGAGLRVFAVQGRNPPRSVRSYHRKQGVHVAFAGHQRAGAGPDIIVDDRVQRIARRKARRADTLCRMGVGKGKVGALNGLSQHGIAIPVAGFVAAVDIVAVEVLEAVLAPRQCENADIALVKGLTDAETTMPRTAGGMHGWRNRHQAGRKHGGEAGLARPGHDRSLSILLSASDTRPCGLVGIKPFVPVICRW